MTPFKNPLPTDFREHLHKTVPEQMAMYGVGRHTVMRWRRISGISVHQRAWTDEALVTLKELVESGYSYDAIAKRMNVGRKRVCNAVERYRLSKGKAQPRPTVRPVPDDFVAMWTENPVSWLVKHYGASTKTVRRWVVSKGLKRVQKGANVRAVDFTRQPASVAPKIAKPGYMTAPIDRGYKEDSAAGEAQRYLQAEGYRPVVRCDAAGIAKQHGAMWICGRAVGLTDCELVAKAGEIRERRDRMIQGSKAA